MGNINPRIPVFSSTYDGKQYLLIWSNMLCSFVCLTVLQPVSATVTDVTGAFLRPWGSVSSSALLGMCRLMRWKGLWACLVHDS